MFKRAFFLITLIALITACTSPPSTPTPETEPTTAPQPTPTMIPTSTMIPTPTSTPDPIEELTSRFSMVGSWQHVVGDSRAVPCIIFWGVVRLGADQKDGIVMACWAWHQIEETSAEFTQTRVLLLAQQADGTLRDVTDEYLPSAEINGAGSVLVADFNGDERDDIFLAAHNESPFIAKASTVYLSQADDKFQKLTLDDAVMAHHANLGWLNGQPIVLTAGFYSAQGQTNPIYAYDGNGGFTISTPYESISAMSVAMGDFLGDGAQQLVFGDWRAGPDLAWNDNNQFKQVMYNYAFDGTQLRGRAILLPPPYFEDKPEYASLRSNWDPVSKSHAGRLWTDDINQDGKLDIIVSSEIWPGWKSQLQLLVNQGDGSFIDQTTAWESPWNEDGASDYSLRLADVDNSGIKTYFTAYGPVKSIGFANNVPCKPPDDSMCSLRNGSHGNYILVNDGTGQFHLAMHEEFVFLGELVNQFVSDQIAPVPHLAWDTPVFMAYQTPDGRINFVAMTDAINDTAHGDYRPYYFINVPLGFDLAKDFTKDITIEQRNGSQNIRTFAGDDVIYGGNNGGTCTIDAGEGMDTIIYNGPNTNYTITKTSTGYTISDSIGTDGTDIIKNVETVKFQDTTVDLE